MATFFPRNLDPFNRVLAEDSWVFKVPSTDATTLDSQTGGNAFTGTLTTSGTLNYNALTTEGISANPHTLVGDQDASFACRMYIETSLFPDATLSFGEAGQRYNLEFNLAYNGNYWAELRLHKNGSSINVQTSSGWHHFGATYSLATQTTTFYLDGAVIGTIPLQMKWLANNTQFARVQNEGVARVTDIIYWKTIITPSEMLQLANNDFPLLPPRDIDPFNDGNLTRSYALNNYLGDDLLNPFAFIPTDANLALATDITKPIYQDTFLTKSQSGSVTLVSSVPHITIDSWAFSCILGNEDTNINNQSFVAFNQLKVKVSGTGVIFTTSTGIDIVTVSSPNRHFGIAISYSNNLMSFYVDGLLVGTHSENFNVSTVFYISNEWSGSVAYLDEILFFEDALTEAQGKLISNNMEVAGIDVTINPDSLLLSTTVLTPEVNPFLHVTITTDVIVLQIVALELTFNTITITPLFINLPITLLGGVVSTPSVVFVEEALPIMVTLLEHDTNIFSANSILIPALLNPAMVYRTPSTDLDPLSSGLLLERWMFDNTNDTIQVGSNLVDDNGLILPYSSYTQDGGYLTFYHDNHQGYDGGSDDTVVSTSTSVPSQLDGDIDASFHFNFSVGRSITFDTNPTVFYYHQGVAEVAYGEFTTFNNIAIKAIITSGGATSVDISVDKGAVSFLISNVIKTVDVTYNSVTKQVKIYTNGVLQVTQTNTMVFDNTALIEINGSSVAKFFDIHYSNSVSSDLDIVKMYTGFYPDETSVLSTARQRGSFLDPLGDGSLIHSWGFEDTLLDDQGIITLDAPCIFLVGNYPAYNLVGLCTPSATVAINNTNFPTLGSNYTLSMMFDNTFDTGYRFGDSSGNVHPKLTADYTKTTGILNVRLYAGTISTICNQVITPLHKAFVVTISVSELDGIFVYVDGILISNLNISGDFSASTNKELYFTANTGELFIVDEILLFNKALTLQECQWVGGGCQEEYVEQIEPIYPSILLPILANNVVVSVSKTTLVDSLLLTLDLFTPSINALVVLIRPDSFFIPILSFTPYTYGNADLAVADSSTLINIVAKDPQYVGWIVTKPTFGHIGMAQVLTIRISMYYIQTNLDVFAKAQSLVIPIQPFNPVLNSVVFQKPLLIPINITSNVAQPYKDKRVSSIGGVNFDTDLYWSENLMRDTYIAKNLNMVDGSSVLSVTSRKNFAVSYLIESKSGIILDEQKVQELITIVNTNVHTIIFSDGSFEYMKFDLLHKPLSINPIFEGSGKYYITVKVLI